MRVCLLNSVPLEKFDRSHVFPYGFSSLNSWLELRCGFAVDMIFPELERLDDAALFQRLRAARYDVVGIGGFWDWLPNALRLSELVKEALPEAVLVMGGVMVSATPELVLRKSRADYVIRGEGEIAFEKLLRALAEGRVPEGIPGVAWLDGDRLVDNGMGEPVDLELLPDHDYDKVPCLDHYHFNQQFTNMSPPVSFPMGFFMIGRGCPYHCSFCFSVQKFRQLSVDTALERLTNYVQRYKLKYIAFSDDTFTAKRGWILEFCRRLKEARLGIQYYATSRVNVFDDELAEALKASGCNAVHLAIEVADDLVLKSMHKNISVEQARQCWKRAYRHGLMPWISAIHGLPGESYRTWQQTHKTLVESIAPTNTIKTSINIFPLAVYPGAELYTLGKQRGLIQDDFQYYHEYHELQKRISFLDYPMDVVSCLVKMTRSALDQEFLKNQLAEVQHNERQARLLLLQFDPETGVLRDCAAVLRELLAQAGGATGQPPRFMVWGTSNAFLTYWPALEQVWEHALGFLDNNPEQQGRLLHGKPIYSPQELERLAPELVFVCSSAFKAIHDQIVMQFSDLAGDEVPALPRVVNMSVLAPPTASAPVGCGSAVKGQGALGEECRA